MSTEEPGRDAVKAERETTSTGAERRMIRPSFVVEALDCARRLGVDPAAALAAAGFSADVAEPVSAEAYGRMWLGLAAAMEDEFLGLGARPMRPGSFVMLCRAVLHSGTLERALRRLLRFLDALIAEPRGELVVADGLAQIVLRESGPPRSAFAYRTYWIILHGVVCWLVGRRLALRLVDFRAPEPEGVADYARFFGAPVGFSRPVSRIAFDARHLALPIDRSDAALAAFLRAAPANLLVRYRYDAGTVATVRARLQALPPTRWPDFTETARQLRLSTSTLRHRLRQEGLSWTTLRDDLRRERAIAALTGTTRAVAEIAADLGYAEPSAFHRAFRKWTGESPGAFRRTASPSPPQPPS